jgi:diaminohydroxyphosphoribosylaminopyrimidine deaminase/5-amino-6-(5-phosphoribosylamino)uracil reductase
MRRCLELARNAAGFTAPNPMVGCVIVHNGRIIGEDFHRRYGTPHAEANAIEAVAQKELLPHSTLYVNLEPCAHHGKTPPCTDLIIAHKIPHVVIGSTDPNPLVSGKGVKKLRAAGCRVTENMLESECKRLNIRFMTFHRLQRPYVILKWAQTADGFIDAARTDTAQRPMRITGDYEQMLTHKWRSEESAIMIGTNTALLDDPMLNLRRWHGQPPLRVTLDRTLRLPASLHLLDGSQPTMIFTETTTGHLPKAAYAVVPFDRQLPEHILAELHRCKCLSVLVEGGAQLLQTFINSGLWDEARVFGTNMQIGTGVRAPLLPVQADEKYTLRNSILQIIRNNQTKI